MAKKTRGRGWELISAGGRSASRPRERSEAPSEQRIELREERRSKGKVMTVARGFLLTRVDLQRLLKELKSSCGAGGKSAPGDAATPGHMEIQGQQADKLAALLSDRGFEVRRR